MARAGVSSEHAERVMGHAISASRASTTASLHRREGGRAARLATLIDSIVHPRENVLPFAKRAKRR